MKNSNNHNSDGPSIYVDFTILVGIFLASLGLAYQLNFISKWIFITICPICVAIIALLSRNFYGVLGNQTKYFRLGSFLLLVLTLFILLDYLFEMDCIINLKYKSIAKVLDQKVLDYSEVLFSIITIILIVSATLFYDSIKTKLSNPAILAINISSIYSLILIVVALIDDIFELKITNLSGQINFNYFVVSIIITPILFYLIYSFELVKQLFYIRKKQ